MSTALIERLQDMEHFVLVKGLGTLLTEPDGINFLNEVLYLRSLYLLYLFGVDWMITNPWN